VLVREYPLKSMNIVIDQNAAWMKMRMVYRNRPTKNAAAKSCTDKLDVSS